jgi:hypothetical protein
MQTPPSGPVPDLASTTDGPPDSHWQAIVASQTAAERRQTVLRFAGIYVVGVLVSLALHPAGQRFAPLTCLLAIPLFPVMLPVAVVTNWGEIESQPWSPILLVLLSASVYLAYILLAVFGAKTRNQKRRLVCYVFFVLLLVTNFVGCTYINP